MFKLNSISNTTDLIMTEAQFNKIVSEEPGLTYIGFEDPSMNNFDENRKTLKQSFNEFKICCEWIEKYRTDLSKRELKDYNFLRHNINSYYLKHAVEKWAEQYISNGALIAALIYFEIAYKPILGSPDVSAFIILDKNTPYL